MLRAIALSAIIGLVAAECPNACSGHGQCSTFDMCTCWQNWQAADCSQRTCPFDLAHVDTPKGDLDMSNSIDVGVKISQSTVYPRGTQEKFPNVVDGDGSTDKDSAHFYMECSNKGICDRKTGECECFDGYDGTACQRASCPSGCSGHGTCMTIADLAYEDSANVYALWDAEKSMGCKCDPGYTGSDCSSRTCKVGIDPLYIDDTTARVTTTTVTVSTQGVSTPDISGTFALKFYDYWGEDYITDPITSATTYTSNVVNGVPTGSDTCRIIMDKLLALPNDVIPSISCSGATVQNTDGTPLDSGYKFTLTFTGNPGYLKPLEVITNLDGSSPTLTGTNLEVATYNEVTGEDTDHFASKCQGLLFEYPTQYLYARASTTAGTSTWNADAQPGSTHHLSFFMETPALMKALKICLGDSDGNPDNNVEVYNWDTGAISEYVGGGGGAGVTNQVMGSHPHAIKTEADPSTSVNNPSSTGQFHLLWYDSTASNTEFRIAGSPLQSGQSENQIALYTTDGVVQMLGMDDTTPGVTQTTDVLDAYRNETRVTGYFTKYDNKVYTSVDTSCETGDITRLQACIQKGDKMFIVDGCWGEGITGSYFGGSTLGTKCAAPADVTENSGNLFTVNKVYTQPHSTNTKAWDAASSSVSEKEDRYVIVLDSNLKWDGSAIENSGDDAASTTNANSGIVRLFKFTPSTAGTGQYTYVAECSNRGSCDRETGLCSCFKGYTGDDCSSQNALAA